MKSCEFLKIFLIVNAFLFFPSASPTKAEGILNFLPAIIAATQNTGTGNITGLSNIVGQLNDTGITWGGTYPSGINNDCSGTEIGAQDCSNGRDATNNDDFDGHAGFSFTKLDSNGHSLPASATAWSCVQDNVTGLIWEVKTDQAGLHDKHDLFGWYNTDIKSNGGYEGPKATYDNECYGYDKSDPTTYCSTEAYVERVNAEGWCGASDWRLPTRLELQGIVSRDRVNPATDTNYFPNTLSGSFALYWTSTPIVHYSGNACSINFYNGQSEIEPKYQNYLVRLVRNGK